MKKLLLIAVSSIAFSGTAQAAAGMISYSVEPIIGYERVQKLIPTAHTRERLVYGARVVAGLPLVSAEGEFTRAMDTEVFSSPTQTIADTEDRARVGLRSTFKLNGFLNIFVRAGAQAGQARHDITDAGGTTTTTTDPIKYRPYAGAGLRVNMGSKISLNADLTTVFHSFPSMNNNDYLTTASLAVYFP